MEKCGDGDDCISTSEAAELASALSEENLNSLPMPGQVDFINGGPPCQVPNPPPSVDQISREAVLNSDP